MGGGSIVGGRYELVRKLAEGGMGAVWEARHTLSKKTVALKILAAETVRDETSRTRFLREVAAPAQIGHEGIVEVYDAGFDASVGSLFVAMEMLEGETLRALLSRGRLAPSRVVGIVLELLPALAAAHAAGFIHRDLKPENIFLHRRRGGSERVKILDFGIARSLLDESSVTQSGVAMGTPHYMSPEQASSARDVTAATDVWAVGVILYEALVHETPFRGDTLASLVVDVITRPHRPTLEAAPSLPPALAAVVDRCLDKDANRRPRDAAALHGLLESAASASGLGAPRAPPPTLDHAPPDRALARTFFASGEPPSDPAARASAQAAILEAASANEPGLAPRPGTLPAPGAVTLPSPSGGSNLPPTAAFPATSALSPAPFATGSSATPAPTVPGVHHTPNPREAAGASPTGVGSPSARAPWLWALLGLGAVGALVVSLLLVAGLGLFAYSMDARSVRGALGGGDLTLAGGQLYDSYEYEWRAGGRLQLHARSSAFEAHIILHTPSGRQLDSSDGDGARIDMTLAETGIYRVIVTSRRAFQLGDYELEIDAP